MTLSGPALLAVDDLKRETVHVDAWDCPITLRELTASEMDAWEQMILDLRTRSVRSTLPHLRAALLVKVMIDPETGTRLFSDEQAAELGAKSSRAIGQLWAIACRMNALTQADQEAILKN